MWDLQNGIEITRVWPPGEGDWIDVLPSPYDADPVVVALMVIEGSSGALRLMEDGEWVATVTSPSGTTRMVQVIEPHLPTWLEHESIAEKYGFRMLEPEHIGRVSELPKHLLLSHIRFPMLLLADALYAAPLNLRTYFRSLTRSSSNGN